MEKQAQPPGEIREAWKKIQIDYMRNQGIKWSEVTGPMRATAKTLIDHEWKITQPNIWIRPIEGDEKELAKITGKAHKDQEIVRTFGKDVERQVWERAASHFLGKGLEKGEPDLEPARNARRKILKEGEWHEAKALDKIICGACWYQERFQRNQQVQRKCHRCGQEETAWHALWSCPKLDHHQREEVINTQWMKTMIEKEGHKEKHECSWGRAILPNWLGKGTARTRFAEDIMMLETENYNQLNAECKESASDGSGGPGHVPKALRKVGAAAAIIKANRQEGRIKVEDVAFMMSEVHGKQTVPRAEVLGDIMANIEPDEEVTHKRRYNYSDASYVVNGASKSSKKSLVDGPNGDLWEVRESMREENKNNRETKKIKSHAQQQVLDG